MSKLATDLLIITVEECFQAINVKALSFFVIFDSSAVYKLRSQSWMESARISDDVKMKMRMAFIQVEAARDIVRTKFGLNKVVCLIDPLFQNELVAIGPVSEVFNFDRITRDAVHEAAQIRPHLSIPQST